MRSAIRMFVAASVVLALFVIFQPITHAAQNVGYDVTSDLWAKAVLKPSSGDVTLIWKSVGTDITPSGAQVVSGYFYADPDDFAYGSIYNPEVFVKIYIDPSGWCNIAFNHVTVDNVDVYTAHHYGGSADKVGTVTLNSRLAEHQYTGVSIDNIISASGPYQDIGSDNILSLANNANDGGYILSSALWAKAVLQVAGNPVALIWKAVGSDTTPSGDWVVSGYFYADSNDFAYGSVYNPEIFVKVYIASNGWANIAFNHVTVDDVSVYSAHQYAGAPTKTESVNLNVRLSEHQYDSVVIEEAPAPTLVDRTVYLNPSDSKLYSFSTESGELLTYYGHRADSGGASSISHLDYVDTDGNSYQISYDAQGLPAKVVAEDGTSIQFDYDFSGLHSNASRAAASTGVTNISSVGITVITQANGVPVEVQTMHIPDQPVVVDLNQTIIDHNLTEPVGNVEINVNKCGEPINPYGGVSVHYRGVHSSLVHRYPATKTSQPGRYVSWIPQRSVDPIPATLESTCTFFADKLSDICNVYNPVAVGAGATLIENPAFQASVCAEAALAASAIATPVVGANVGAACGALFVGGQLTCSTLGWGNPARPVPDTKNVAQMLCGQVEEALNGFDAALDLDKVVIQGVANFGSGSGSTSSSGQHRGVYTTGEQEVSAFGPYPSLNINSLEPSIDGFTASPAFPDVGQGYTATVDLSCVLGADLTMTVERDDLPLTAEFGYGLSETASFSVDVPAAPVGSVDMLNMHVENDATSETAEKNFSVQFKPKVSVTATDDEAGEQSNTAMFTLTRLTGDNSSALTVLFNLSGTAKKDVDYIIEATASVEIPAGSDEVTIMVVPIADTTDEAAETVVLTLSPAAGYKLDDDNSQAMIAIVADESSIDLSGYPKYYTGTATYRETLANNWEGTGAITCESTATWEARLASGGGIRINYPPPTISRLNSEGPYCYKKDNGDFTDRITGSHSDGSFSINVDGSMFLRARNETFISGSYDEGTVQGGYTYVEKATHRDYGPYLLNVWVEFSLTRDSSR